ncbi:N-acetylmuramoyl-L-alanine amidase [Staphylococcus saprophyticus]|uniref:N-acetylmuramoyl-L-alanine amidase n=1 Tax=Staphylococcus saprophyticus TaxID=29385 RepID=UPI0019CFEF8D|nr:N-acetylmuramoyl-L-alanine amidase [Staphylococcus saprophyticus]MBN6755853.1 N-acetylmuramoyl-L-alanine amidase [Staphylococcus saprophyticus]MBN6765831.1 N-acetylmuramoyl-L-alanine amidase [Staphylococcus saprophyticus]MBN6771268.1 N-acetylmuramoyl-L-alanine amidase [Staphylococcus saprophyticus]MBN6780166.1 N-acetylmuramoyl-L-alanine amidase [Staphylococcus saprophyticus]MBN6787596.1 N-acetylmuramoyl-L-alanine amidase [Staphylococcus saprophyticus]
MTEKWNGVPVRYDWLPIGTRRSGQKLTSGKPIFAVAHDTGNPNTTAQDNVNYYKNSYNIDWSLVASAHIFVDDKECIVCIPVTEKAWHVLYNTPIDNNWYNADANDAAFGVEGSYFDDKARSKKSLDNMARVMAYLCNYWKIDYKTEVPGHQDIQSDKVDPGNLLQAAGYSRNISNFDKQVAKYINGVKEDSNKEPSKDLSEPTKEKPTPSPQSNVEYKAAIEYMHSLKGQYIDFDNAWAYQCADLVVDFVDHVTNGVRFWGNAKDLHIVNSMPKGWKVVENTRDYIPPITAIAIYTTGIYREYGHTGLVWDNSGGTSSFTILEQNYDGNANSPAKLRTDNYSGLTHFIVPDFADDSVDLTDIKPVKPKETTQGTALQLNAIPPKKLTWSNQPYFKAVADNAGATICRPNHNNVMVLTNEVYGQGDVFYVYEIRDGWARVYSASNNGYVWYERLRITEVYKPGGGENLKNKADKQTVNQKTNAKKTSGLKVGSIPSSKVSWSKKCKFRGRVDHYGATIAKRSGKKGNYKWSLTNEVYKAGYDDFYIFEVLDGWCRVYSHNNNGWVWHERLRVVEVY